MNPDSDDLCSSNAVDSGPEQGDDFLLSDATLPTAFGTQEENKLRRKLRFFYMNPIEKWQFKRRFPYKFLVQLIKIIVVTLQSCLFAYHRSFYINFVAENQVSFSHLFLEGWDSSREVVSYPPQSGDLAIYKKSEFFSAIDYAVGNYGNLDQAIGSYFYSHVNDTIDPLTLCLKHYEVCELFGFNESYFFKNNIKVDCVSIVIDKDSVQYFSSEAYFQENNFKVDFEALIEGFLYFGVKTINLKPVSPRAVPDCYFFNLSLWFNNQAHDGKVKLSLLPSVYRLGCNGSTEYQSNTAVESFIHSFINSIVIVFCIVSFVLCVRALFRAQILRKRAEFIFKEYHNVELKFSERLNFVNFWYVTMMASDVIVIAGSSLKEKIEMDEFSGDQWNLCSVLLGTGTFLIWVCILRYLGFFKTYNVVVLTLKVAAPMIMRFMVCTMLIFAGFTFCGWLVLGPYHEKFRTLSVTAECLFALLNGDDVFDTFSTLQRTDSGLMWWFCRVYLYFFVTLFIYVIISLFISIILDAYETIKKYYKDGFPKNYIQHFLEYDETDEMVSDSSSLVDNLPRCADLKKPYSFGCVARTLCCIGPNQPGEGAPES